MQSCGRCSQCWTKDLAAIVWTVVSVQTLTMYPPHGWRAANCSKSTVYLACPTKSLHSRGSAHHNTDTALPTFQHPIFAVKHRILSYTVALSALPYSCGYKCTTWTTQTLISRSWLASLSSELCCYGYKSPARSRPCHCFLGTPCTCGMEVWSTFLKGYPNMFSVISCVLVAFERTALLMVPCVVNRLRNMCGTIVCQ